MENILIVDDQKDVRDEIEKMILGMNFGFTHILQASCSDTAIKLIKKYAPGIILLDVVMPGDDGFSVAEYINTHNINIEIIVITGFQDFNFAIKAIKSKVRSFLLKPISEIELHDIILEIFKTRKLAHMKVLNLSRHNHLYYRMLDEYLSSQGSDLNFKKISINTGLDDIDSPILMILIVNTYENNPANEMLCTISQWLSDRDMKNIFYLHNSECFVFIIGLTAPPNNMLIDILSGIIHNLFNKYSAGAAFKDSCAGVKSIFKEANFAVKYACSLNMLGKLVVYNWLNIAIALTHKHSNRLFELYKNKILAPFEEATDALFVDYMQNMISPSDAGAALETTWEKYGVVLPGLRDSDSLNIVHSRFMNHLQPMFSGGENGTVPEKITQILDYVSKHYMNPLDLTIVANTLNMGYSYASTLFKKYIGQSFTQYLNNYRMSKAVELLENTNCFIYEVAGKVGFESNKYFFKKFKELYSTTPVEFREHICQERNKKNVSFHS